MTVTLAQLLEGHSSVEVARLNERVADAMERMREHDYSQLPVVEDGATSLRAIGLISLGSIARTSLHLDISPSQLRVHHAVERHPVRRKLGDELWRTLDDVRGKDVLLVEDEDGVLRGILTGNDFATYLRRQAEDTVTVLDIEAAVKQLIADNYRDRDDELRRLIERELGVQQRDTERGVRAVVTRCLAAQSVKFDAAVFDEGLKKAFPDRVIYEFDRLTFSQYQSILLSGDCWQAYEDDFDLPVERVRALLDDARNLRNQIAHNRGLPTPAERAKLVFCRDLFGRVADRRQEPNAQVIEVVPVPAAEPEAVEANETDESDDGKQQSFAAWKLFDYYVESTERLLQTFERIEEATGPLPPAARAHRSWWTNDEDAPQAAQWLDAGLRVVGVNLAEETVVFVRNTSREAASLKVFSRLLRRLGERSNWPQMPPPSSSPSQDLERISVGGGLVELGFGFSVGDRFRVSVRLISPTKAVFETLAARRDELERTLGSALTWDRMAHRRVSRVSLNYPREISIMAGDEAIEQLAEWVAEYVPRFWTAVRECLGVSESSEE